MEACNFALVLQNGLLISIKNRNPLLTVFEINTPLLQNSTAPSGLSRHSQCTLTTPTGRGLIS